MKHYLNNTSLNAKGHLHQYTKEQIKEIEKCRDDVHYFAEKYFTIVNIDKGKIKIPLYDYQKNLLDHIDNNLFSLIVASRQSGKCEHINTIVKIKHKETGEIQDITIGELYEKAAHSKDVKTE